jgi:hypothetical protein
MITHHVPNLTAQQVIKNTMQMIQCIQASGPVSAEVILCTELNDMVFTTYKVLNLIEDPGLHAKEEADLSGHPQNEPSGPLAFFYLMQNVCNLKHNKRLKSIKLSTRFGSSNSREPTSANTSNFGA